MRFPRFSRTGGWRFVAVPVTVWFLMTAIGTAGLGWFERDSRQDLVQRFQLRVGLAGDFVTTYVADLIERQRVQAAAFLTDPVVQARDFQRSVNGFGYPAAVLLDSSGRALHVAPADRSLTGRDLTRRYAHLRIAVQQGRAAVSPVVPSAARGVPVVGFAVPFDTASGRRVFSGAVEISHSPLASYLSTAIPLSGVEVHLVDASGAIVAANHHHEGVVPTLAGHTPDLAAALRRQAQGRYEHDGRMFRYASEAIPGTPWRLSATVSESVLFAPVVPAELAGRAAVTTAAAVGLLVVAAVGRARRNRRELQLSEERFRKVFDGSRIGMVLTDPVGTMLRVNPALCQMLARPETDLLGRRLADITHLADITRPTGTPGTTDGGAGLRDCLAGRIDGFDVDRQYQHADGHRVEASVTVSLLRDEAGRPQYFATQIIDVTERRALENARDRHETALAEHAEKLQHANAQMTDFIAMLTHDVRQPLASVVAAGEFLLDDWVGQPDDVKQHYVRRMTAAGHRADHLVDEILTLAQLDAGALTARVVRVDVADAVREAVAAHLHDPDHAVAVVAPDGITAYADPVHLQLMLANLLGNAVKYGAPPITVTVRARRHHVGICLSDHGEGVPEAFVPHLFDRFTRADTGVATTKPGTGIGLYFVRQLADANGLTVDYQPHQPRGATFTITLPRVGVPVERSTGTAGSVRGVQNDPAVPPG